jgi:hypothetical protein
MDFLAEMVCFMRCPVHDRTLPVRWRDPLPAGFESINAIGGGRNGLGFWCRVYCGGCGDASGVDH